MKISKMASSLQVLCPNGRRQNVQINPNTKLLQILEEVCQCQGFIPPEDYKLVQGQGRKELDLSLSVRYCSLANNAKLEMIKCASTRVEQDVTIALQLDSGQRLQDVFKPSTNLWDILLHMENKNSDYKDRLIRVDTSQTPAIHPVCIFMREEMIGESALTATTLKKLGLTSGKAIIRLLHRSVDDKVLSEIEKKIEKEKQKQTKLEEIAVKKSEMRLLDEMERNRKSGDAILDDVKEETASEYSEMDTCEGSPQFAETSLGTRVDNTEPMHEVPAESPPTASASKKPSNQDNRGQSHRSQQSSATDALRNLNIPGVEIFTPDDFHDLTPQEQNIAQRLLHKFVAGLPPDALVHSTGSSSRTPEQSEEQTISYADFKFPEETRGMDLTGSASSNSLGNEQPCDREFLVYSTDESLSSVTDRVNALSDDFFEVTQADVKIMYRDLQNAVRQMEDQPLMTKSMRQAQFEAIFDKYERIVIRVQFPDRLTLQGLFRPREPVSALYAFVKEHLSNHNEEFYLYTAPPKKILKDKTSSLAACHLAPAAVVYCGSESQKELLLTKKKKISHRLEAEAQVSRVLHSTIDGATFSTAGTSTSAVRTTPSQADQSRVTRRSDYGSSSSSGPTTLPSGSQVPKWLRLSKK